MAPAGWSSIPYGEDVLQWLNVTCPGRLIGHWRPITWPPLPIRLALMDLFFSCWNTWNMTSSSCDNNWCQHVKVCSIEYHTAHCQLPWNGWWLLKILQQWGNHDFIILWCICSKQELRRQQRQTLLGDIYANMPIIARQQLCKHTKILEPSASNMPMQQLRNCWKWSFLWSPCQGYILT